MRLRPNVAISGEIFVDRQPILNLPYPDLVAIRRHKVAHIFQEPACALNPVLTVGYQLLEIAEGLGRKDRVLGMLREVGFRDPRRVFRSYPYELSGGMQQRIMIALALMNRPKLLIADEPTTAFDVILQDQILALIKALQRDLGFAMLLITHDFSILQRMADRVCVMSRGEIVERGMPDDIIFRPRHECTKLLSESILMLPRESN
jgi:ABC-type dipeptide/oligopeptide/nickel transport system ATPase component